VEGYNLEPVRSVYEYPIGALLHVPEVNDEVERELSSISRDCYQTVVPCLVASASLRFDSSAVFFTDGGTRFGDEAGTRFGVYQLNGEIY
jgi:hypothetical protein